MKLKTTLLAVLIFSALFCTGQNLNVLESKLFLDSVRIEDGYEWLQALNYDSAAYVDCKLAIDEHIKELKSQKIEKKSLKKQIQIIYKSTHSKFFVKYEERAFFKDISTSGNYNCVTATAMYALIFSAFDINYTIRETPTHVYIIADPDGLQTMIESTLPGANLFSYDDKYRREYIEYLRANKIIAESEFSSKTVNQLFEEHFNNDKKINLIQLAALQYYNKGVFLSKDEKYFEAAQQFKLASELYPSENILFNLQTALRNTLVTSYKNKTFNGLEFGGVMSLCIGDSTLDLLTRTYFKEISQELCVTNPDLNRYNAFFNDIVEVLSLDRIPDDIIFTYHYSKAHHFGMLSNNAKALLELQSAYAISPEHLGVRELIRVTVASQLLEDGNYKPQIDSIEYYAELFPFIMDDVKFQRQYVYCYMRAIGDAAKLENTKESMAYYKRFLNMIDSSSFGRLNDQHLTYGFVLLSALHAEKNNFLQASEIIERGLKLSPESGGMLQMKEDLKTYQREIERMNRNRTRYIYEEANREEYKSPAEIEREKIRDDVYAHFPGSWRTINILIGETNRALSAEEKFSFEASSNKYCKYTNANKVQIGVWAYRPEIRCLYFIPDDDKDNYLVFKVKQISADRLILIPYKDRKKKAPYTYVLKKFD